MYRNKQIKRGTGKAKLVERDILQFILLQVSSLIRLVVLCHFLSLTDIQSRPVQLGHAWPGSFKYKPFPSRPQEKPAVCQVKLVKSLSPRSNFSLAV